MTKDGDSRGTQSDYISCKCISLTALADSYLHSIVFTDWRDILPLFDDLDIMTLSPTFDGGQETTEAGADDQYFQVCFGITENVIHEDPSGIILVNHDCTV